MRLPSRHSEHHRQLRVRAAFLATWSAVTLATIVVTASPLAAQTRPGTRSATSAPSIAGVWTGTATVPLKDSSIVVPVMYTFTQSGSTFAGTAVVPGQGSGPIANVVREGARLRFRVTAPEGKLLEHDGMIGSDGAIEGMVNLDNLPVAKFRIAPRKPDATKR